MKAYLECLYYELQCDMEPDTYRVLYCLKSLLPYIVPVPYRQVNLV